jgi:hypothetical protein
MPRWMVDCPNCGTSNEIPADAVAVDCGTVLGLCTCVNCGTEFSKQQPYWRWLGLDEAPPVTAADS